MGVPARGSGRTLTKWPDALKGQALEHTRDLAATLPESLVFLRAGRLDGDQAIEWEIVEVPGVKKPRRAPAPRPAARPGAPRD